MKRVFTAGYYPVSKKRYRCLKWHKAFNFVAKGIDPASHSVAGSSSIYDNIKSGLKN